MSAINSLGLIPGGGSGGVGPRGADGTSVDEITYDDASDSLVFDMSDGTTKTVPFPGLNLNLESDIILSGPNSATKLQVKNASEVPIFNINTSTGAGRFSTSDQSYTDISGSSVIIKNNVGSGNWGFMKIEGAFNQNTTDSLYLTNNGTGPGTGTFVQFDGHDGGNAQNYRISFNGTNVSYINGNSIGEHIFNRNVVPTLSNSTSLGRTSLRWSNVFTTLLNANGASTLAGITNNGGYTQTGTSNNTFTGLINILTNGTGLSLTSQNNTSGISMTINGGTSSGGIYYENNGSDEGLILTSKAFPVLSSIFDLGTTNRRWKTLFADNTNIRGEILASVMNPGVSPSLLTLTNTGTIANTGATITFNGNSGSGATSSTISFNGTGLTYSASASGDHAFNSTIRPVSNNAYPCGTSGNRWNGVWATNADFTDSNSGTSPTRLTIGNLATASGSGGQVLFTGGNGTTATNANINFSGTHMTYSNNAVGGHHVFSNIVRSSGTGNISLGTSGNRWGTIFTTIVDASGVANGTVVNRLTLGNAGTGLGTGSQLTFSGHNGSAPTSAFLRYSGNDMNYEAPGSHAFIGSSVRPFSDNSIPCGTTDARWSLVYSAGGVSNTSDEREKNSITNDDLGLDFINQLRPVKYKFNVIRNDITYNNVPRVDSEGNPVYQQVPVLDQDGGYVYDENGEQLFEDGPQIIDRVPVITPIPGTKFHHGLIVQEVEQVLSDNNMTENDFAGLDKSNPNRFGLVYSEFIGPLIKSVQQLKAIVDQQADRITTLENELSALIQ